VITSTNRGEPLVLDPNNNSRAAQAVSNIARRLCGENVPYLDLGSERESILDRLKKIFSVKG
jgi:septum site-determining protein MinD